MMLMRLLRCCTCCRALLVSQDIPDAHHCDPGILQVSLLCCTCDDVTPCAHCSRWGPLPWQEPAVVYGPHVEQLTAPRCATTRCQRHIHFYVLISSSSMRDV